MNKEDLDIALVNIKDMTPEEHRAWLDKVEETTKSALDRWHNRVSPEPRAGYCRICTGLVTEKYSWENHKPIKFGGPPNGYWKSSGLSCIDCGIMYAKLPKP